MYCIFHSTEDSAKGLKLQVCNLPQIYSYSRSIRLPTSQQTASPILDGFLSTPQTLIRRSGGYRVVGSHKMVGYRELNNFQSELAHKETNAPKLSQNIAKSLAYVYH